MRPAILFPILCACSMSGTPTFFEGHATGTLDGAPVKLDFRLDDDGQTGLVARNGAFVAELTSGSWSGPGDAPRLVVALPGFPVLAGARQLPLSIRLSSDLELVTDNRNAAVLDFESARWIGEGEERVAMRGSWLASYRFARGELQFSAGKFQVVARCGAGNPDPRVCGGDAPVAALKTNCPREVTAPFDSTPAPDACAGRLCMADRHGIDVAGCRWRSFGIFDRTGTNLTVAGWAEAPCAGSLPSCTAFR